MRAEPAHKHEIVSQLLFGEVVTILEEGINGWVKVKCLYDDYEGWVTAVHLGESAEEQVFNESMAAGWVNTIRQDLKPMHIPYGSMLPLGDKVITGKHAWDFSGVERVQTISFSEPALRSIAGMYFNTAYMWGGRSVFAIDCSGFAQQVLRHFGVPIPRDANLQAQKGEALGFLQEAKAGDLAFFDEPDGRITHVAILLNEHEVIHASGKVRIDRIDNEGITSSDTGLRTHRLRVIKRLIQS